MSTCPPCVQMRANVCKQGECKHVRANVPACPPCSGACNKENGAKARERNGNTVGSRQQADLFYLRRKDT
eukprot:1161925-Pelagomonas_calceolata.AAC.13